MSDLYQSIPSEVLGWKASGEDITYNRETLFDYMNGGAEVYLAFGFKHVYVRSYKGPSEDNELVLDIYDMGSSAEAFGIFSCDREDPPAGIGQDSEYGFGLLRFWKGRYFVSIGAMGDDTVAEPVIKELGRQVAGLIKEPGEKPALIKLLPQEGLIQDRISYFHSNVNLANRYFIAAENILLLTHTTNCVFGEYESAPDERAYLLIIQYEKSEHALEGYTSFLDNYIPGSKGTGMARTADQGLAIGLIKENYVSIVFDAPDKEWALDLQSKIDYRAGN